jgi:hypothetical protein
MLIFERHGLLRRRPRTDFVGQPLQIWKFLPGAVAMIARSSCLSERPRGLSQERLAYDAEVDRAYVGNLERKAGNPTVGLMMKLGCNSPSPIPLLIRPSAMNRTSCVAR